MRLIKGYTAEQVRVLIVNNRVSYQPEHINTCSAAPLQCR